MRGLKKLVSILLAMCMIFSSLICTVVFAGDEKTVYIASENFTTENGDGTWDGVWSARVYDSSAKTNTTLAQTATYEGKDAYTLDFGTGKALYIYSGGMAPAQGALTTENTTWPEITFTAPKSGKITVSVNGSLDISGAGSGNTVVNYTGYIDKVEGKNMVTIGSWNGTTNLWGSNNKTIYIQKGETINFRFQPASATSNMTRWIKVDPKITYEAENVYTPVQKNVYKSSDNFGFSNQDAYGKSDGKWDNGVWQAQIHKFVYGENNAEVAAAGNLANPGEYIPIAYYHTNRSELSNTPASTLYSSTTGLDDHLVGAESMRTPTFTTSSIEGMRDWAAVKTFTAPRTGKVTISCDSELKGTVAYVFLTYVIIERNDGSFYVQKIVPINNANANEWTADITGITLEKGEKIHFEIKRRANFNATSNSWNGEITWDPVVIYTDDIVMADAKFEKDGVEVKNFADIAAQGDVNANIKVAISKVSEGEYTAESKTVKAFVAVYDENGALVNLGLSEAKEVKPDGVDIDLPVSLTNSKSLTYGKVKIFLFKDGCLLPLIESPLNGYVSANPPQPTE